LIPRPELFRFARERNLRDVDWDRMAGPGVRPLGRIDHHALESVTTALRRGRAQEARQLILSAHASAGGSPALADRLVRPAMERIGHGWETHTLDVFQEHRATRIVESALMELIQRVGGDRTDPFAPLALGAAPEGDQSSLSGLLCELALREQGWSVMNLGPNLPIASLAKAVRAHRPRLVWLSATHLVDPNQFVRDYLPFYSAATAAGAAVILGGRALGAELRARLLAASFGERLAHLVEFAAQLQSHGPPNDPSESRYPELGGPA
jgi:methanogenic corrinoid protein MtbC1